MKYVERDKLGKPTAREWLRLNKNKYAVTASGRAKAIKDCSRALGIHIRTARKAMTKLEIQTASPAKILVLDIETAPMESYVWRLHKQYISPHQIIKPWSILTWSAKWLCDSDIISARVGPQMAINREDKSILPKLWNLIDEADVIIGHNVKNFDLKRINTRFILSDMLPPSPYQIIDTYKEVKKVFDFSSNKLDELNSEFEIAGKMETKFELWDRCAKGDKSALKYMEEYNQCDVVITEDLYFKIRPWIRSHPNLGLYVESDKTVCPTCGNMKITLLPDQYYVTQAGKYQTFRCDNCGAIGRYRFTEYPKLKRAALARSIAR